jgi:tetratricopeptide (TPR) repeat protein
MKTILSCFIFLAAALAGTPAETAIQKVQAEIAKHPGHYPYYNSLAMAYARRARETSDVQYYQKAQEALQQSFALAPDNYEGRKTETWLHLGLTNLPAPWKVRPG